MLTAQFVIRSTIDAADLFQASQGIQAISFLLNQEFSKPYDEVNWFWVEKLVWEQVAILRGYSLSDAVFDEFQRQKALEEANTLMDDVRSLQENI